MIRLGFHCHIVAQELEGKIYIISHFGRFIDNLAKYCDFVYLFMHEAEQNERAITDYCLNSTNVKLVNIGPHSSVPKRVLRANAVKHTVHQWRDQIDCMLIRGPSPLLPDVAKASAPLPVAILLVADPLAGIDDLPQLFWRKELIRLFWKWNDRRQSKILKHSLTFVNSEHLYKKLSSMVPELILTKTTTLLLDEFNYREDTCINRPLRVLFAGRMDRTKGLLDILEAIAMLVNEGEDIIFDLAGPNEKGDPVIHDLQSRSEALGISDRICFHGYQPLGQSLFALYRKADIFVIASQASEGFPRTIWEAFSQGTPVVATSVGSIPFYLRNEQDALLASPKSPLELALNIKRLVNEPELRQRLIKNGYKLAEENTLDRRAKEMIVGIEEWINSRNH